MTTYQYRSGDGEIIEEQHSMMSYPKSLTRNGKRYEILVTGGAKPRVYELEHKAYSAHRKDRAVELGMPLAPNYDEKGVACYRSKAEIEDHEKRLQRAGYTNWTYEREKLKGTKV